MGKRLKVADMLNQGRARGGRGRGAGAIGERWTV
jgi:hypothetical protein